MTTAELDQFRSALTARQTEIETARVNRDALTIDTSPDELDRIQQASVRELAIDSLERESSRLREVQAALRRVAAGVFGVCLECEQDIHLKRLTAVPWTQFCIACQEALERESQASGQKFDESLLNAA